MVAELGPGALAALLADDDETADPYALADMLPSHLARSVRPLLNQLGARQQHPPAGRTPGPVLAVRHAGDRRAGGSRARRDAEYVARLVQDRAARRAELVRRESRIPRQTIWAAAARSASGPQAAALVMDIDQ
ncbi:hypothetical protein AAH991_36465 [Microbispora sp. ZYX-F-249]|uniref:Uncharacterized protein n=1 Tax=Microbispora maris TaxID=3144104 RepID=A0ABV0B288_9ACTN